MAAGARFCPGCGANTVGDASTAAGHTAAVGPNSRITPLGITAVLAVAATLAIGWALTRPTIAPAPEATGTAAPFSGAQGGGAPQGGVPDISQMTPQEQFLRLSDRVERSVLSGDTATVVRFFPMLESAFKNLSPAERDNDARFHLSLVQAQVGHFPAAIAQVDSIVASVPNHLFAYYLKALIADFQGNTVAAQAARLAFRTHFAAETAAKRLEYQEHQQLLDDFLKTTPEK